MNEQQEIKYAQSIRNQRVDMFLKVSRGLEDLDLTDPETRKLYLSSIEPVNKTDMWHFEVDAFLNKKLSNLAFTRQQNPVPSYDQQQIMPQQPPPPQQAMHPYQNSSQCTVAENPGYQQHQTGVVYVGNEQQYGQMQMPPPQYAQGPQGFCHVGQMPIQMPNQVLYHGMYQNIVQQNVPPNRTTYFQPPNTVQYYGNMQHPIPQQHTPIVPMSYELAGPPYHLPPPSSLPPQSQTPTSWGSNSYTSQSESVHTLQQTARTNNFQSSTSSHRGQPKVEKKCEKPREQEKAELSVEDKPATSIKQIVSEIIAEKTKTQGEPSLTNEANNTEKETDNAVPLSNPVVFPALPSLKTSSEDEKAIQPLVRTDEPSYAEKAAKYTEEPTAPVVNKPKPVQQEDPWKVSELWIPKNFKNGRNYKQNKSDSRGNNKKNYKKPSPKRTEPVIVKSSLQRTEPEVVKDLITFKTETSSNAALRTLEVAEVLPEPVVPSTGEPVKSTGVSRSSSTAEEVDIPKFEDAMEDLKGLDLSQVSPSSSSCYSSVGSQPEQKPKSSSKSGGNKKKSAPKTPKRKSKEELKAEDDYLNELIAENERIKMEQAAREAEAQRIKNEKEELEKRMKQELEEKQEQERLFQQKQEEEFKQVEQRNMGAMQKIQEAFLNEIHVEAIDKDELPEHDHVFTFNFRGGVKSAGCCARMIHGMRLYHQKLISEKNKVFTKEELEALPKFQRSLIEANVSCAITEIEKDNLREFMSTRQKLYDESQIPGDNLRQVFYAVLDQYFVPCMFPSVMHLYNNKDETKILDQLESDFIVMLLELSDE